MKKTFCCLLFTQHKIRTYLLFIFIVQLITFNAYAQNTQLDSLDQLIAKEKTDTGRISLNIKKIIILGRSNLDTAIQLSKQQLTLAEQARFYAGIIKLHSQLASSYTFKGNFDSAKQNIAFLEKYVKASDSSNIAVIYSSYGMLYGIQANYDTSIKFYAKAIAINEKIKAVKELSGNYANIAIGYQQLANFPKALEYQQRSLSLAQEQQNKEVEGKTLLNMGITYEEMGDSAKAEQYYLNSKTIAIKNHYKIIELYVYTNLSSLYINQNRWQEGYEFAMKAADLSSSTGDNGIKAASLAKAVTALANQNKFDEATALGKQAISLADSSKQPLNISQAYESFGTTLFLQKLYKEAIPYFEKCFAALNGAPNYDNSFVESHMYLSECYEKTGDYVKALANYKIAAEIADSVKRKDNIRKATELSMNYDFQKKQDVLAAEKKRDDEVARTKQTALIIGLLLVLVLAIVAFTGYRNKQKANSLLTGQKKQIEDALAELKTTQAQLIQSEKMASLGELTAGIAHEIQNPLNFVNNFSEVTKELLTEMKDDIDNGDLEDAKLIADDVIANHEKINYHGKRAESIVKGMLEHSRANTGQKVSVNFNVLCDEYLRLSYHGLRAKDKSFNADFKTDFDETIDKLNIVQQDVGRVLLNIFNNAFYAVSEKRKTASENYKPLVSIQTKKLNNKVEIVISDNGDGIPQNIIDKIFQPFFTTKPTGSGTGLGLSLAYDIIVKEHNGSIKAESREDEGSTFIITLPVT